jgi:hypothetical protein
VRATSSATRRVVAVALTLMLVTLWALTHRYRGFARDGELYAVQAMARIHPWLAGDLYLQNVSQDRFTVFSSIYAGFIGIFGLQTAELLLFAGCTGAMLAAAWFAVRELFDAEDAWLGVALLIVTVGYYGAYQIFSYSENYLSARSMGEAMIAVALAFRLRGWPVVALLLAAGGLFVHPLMALPGLLLIACLSVSTRQAAVGALAGVLAVLASALVMTFGHFNAPFLRVMDPAWLEVVRERSQFLFLKYWIGRDWEVAIRPFLCLALSAAALVDERARKLCIAGMLVGAAGLAVAWIAGSVGPVPILLQGQAWRWMWVTSFVSVLLLAPTVRQVWRDERGGPLCAILLVFAWVAPGGVDGVACAAAALSLWLGRRHIGGPLARGLRWAAIVTGSLTLAWLLANCWTFAWAPIPESGRESLALGRLREILALGPCALLLAGLVVWSLRRVPRGSGAAAGAALFLLLSLVTLPGALKQLDMPGSAAETAEFADWRAAIPPYSNVLLLPASISATFMWFTLDRPSYLSVGQSAGVVFSAATAAEVRRRADVLVPLGDPDWTILSSIAEVRRRRAAHLPPLPVPPPRPLTAAALKSICGDPALGFVIAQENVGFDPLVHRHPGIRRDWSLYDCRRVRMAPSA